MENASQALMIAAGVLLTVLLFAASVFAQAIFDLVQNLGK